MGSISPIKAKPASTLRIVIGNEGRDVTSLEEARGFLHERNADALAELLLSDMDAKAPGALKAFGNRLEMVRAAL